MNIFKIISIGTQAKQGYRNPEGFLSEASFASVQAFFTLWFLIIGFGLGISFYLGFILEFWFFQILFILGLIIFSIMVVIYRKLKRFFDGVSKQFVGGVRGQFSKRREVKIEVEDSIV